jgi:hypothetical protein
VKDIRNNLELGNRELGEGDITSVGRSAYATQMDEVRSMLEITVLAEELREADSRFYSFLIAAIVGLFVLIGVIVAV